MDPFKHAIQHLSAELAQATDPAQVTGAVERTVRRWIPCERVELRAASDTAGEEPPPSNGALALPATFGGHKIAWLTVSPRAGLDAFSPGDLDLLRTIADQAGLALAHAARYAELDKRRREHLAAWQTERIAIIETVAAEIAHEVRYPINFFRSVFRRDKQGAKLDEEEIDIGCEEVERLERLVSGLKRLAGSRIERRVVAVADLIARVDAVLRDTLEGRTLRVAVPGEAALRCDAHHATQLVLNLVANAIDATAYSGTLGVSWAVLRSGGANLVVWDDGLGFEGDASRLFVPWFTTKPRGTGLGLAIAHRIVRAHGWSIDANRTDGLTCFVVSIPAADVVSGERSPSMAAPASSSHTGGSEHDENPDRR
jgi:signal transduction histidine kinase